MNEVNKLMDALQNDPGAREMAKNIPTPDDEEEAIALYIELGEKLGIKISREDLLSYQREMENAYQASEKEAEASMEKSLNSRQLNMVAGGANPGCKDTHKSGEWCWATDSCQIAVRFYDDWPRQCKENF